MPNKQIVNPGQAFTNGTWGNPPIENETATFFAYFQNNTAGLLYIGDLVCIDVTGQLVNIPTTATFLGFVGVVGQGTSGDEPSASGSILTNAGTNNPMVTTPNRYESVGVTNGSATVTDTGAQTFDVGKTILVPNGASNFLATILTATAGTGYTMSAVYPGTTGTYTAQIINSPSTIGPGFAPITYAANAVVPVITQGYARINCAAASTTAAFGGLLVPTNNTLAGTYVASGSVTAAQGAGLSAIPLEAYAARDLTLTNLGIAGHETVRGLLL